MFRTRITMTALVAALLLFQGHAQAQNAILQGAPWAAGHVPMYAGPGGTQPVVIDSGTAGGGAPGVGLSELGLTARGAGAGPFANAGSGPDHENFCDYDGPVTGPYHYLCLSPNAQGGGLIAFGAAGGAPQTNLNLNINGVSYAFPFVLQGVIGPATSVANDVACWNNLTGSLLKDCGTFPVQPIGANPTAQVGASPVNGVATTFMRSDAAPPLAAGAASANIGTLSGALNGSVLPATTIANSYVTNAMRANMQPNTISANSTNGTAAPTDMTLNGGSSCNGPFNAEIWTNGTGFTCNTIPASTVPSPQGRLTLTTGTAVLTAGTTSSSTIYYDCYRGASAVPYYTGTTDAVDTVASCEVSTVMQASSTGVINSGDLFDAWWVHSGASRLCIATNGSGGGWASDTAGSLTARGTGYTQLDKTTRPYITNKNPIAHCYNGATDYGSVAANQATYLGTLYTSSTATTVMQFKPSATSGGNANILGLYNAYNRIRIGAVSQDSQTAYTYSTATWRAPAGGSSNNIHWVDGLQQSSITASYRSIVQGTTGSAGAVGVDFDSTSAQPAMLAVGGNGQIVVTLEAIELSPPLMGYHYAQGVEESTSGGQAISFNVGSGPQTIQIGLEM